MHRCRPVKRGQRYLLLIHHFFKLKSNFGITYTPFGQTAFQKGVEIAPDVILKRSFINTFQEARVTTLSAPKILSPKNLNQLACKLCSLRKNELPVVIGGDHSITFPSLLATLLRFKNPSQIGVIQFDSHADINLKSSSPTKNFHGMYLRPFFDTFDIPDIDHLIPTKIPTSNLLYIGNLNLDPEEKQFICKNKIKNLARKDIQKSKKALGQIQDFANRFKHLHISFDIDVLDKSEAPATGIPATDGLFKEDLFPILRMLSNYVNLSVDLAEVNPLKPGAKKTIQAAQQVLVNLLIP